MSDLAYNHKELLNHSDKSCTIDFLLRFSSSSLLCVLCTVDKIRRDNIPTTYTLSALTTCIFNMHFEVQVECNKYQLTLGRGQITLPLKSFTYAKTRANCSYFINRGECANKRYLNTYLYIYALNINIYVCIDPDVY